MTNTDLLYARMTPGALKSIPRMFSNFQDVMVELLQNAYRAGAQNVTITYEVAQGTLEVGDDGPGLSNAQVLLDAGDSGWNETVAQAVCPAGMGAMAAFAFASKVVFTSRLADGTGWRLTATPEVLLVPAQPALLEPLSHAAGEHGFSIKLFLSGESVVSDVMIKRARALYPFHVVLRTAQGEQVLEPYRTFKPALVIETLYGQVEWAAHQFYSSVHDEPTEFSREGQWHSSRVLRAALKDAAARHPAAAVATILAARPLLWHVPDGDAIQLHLPDRTELIETVGLHRAAEAIVAALTAAVIDEAQATARGWPDRMDATFLPRSRTADTPEWLEHDEQIRTAVVTHLGWHLVEYQPFGELWINEDGDGVNISGDHEYYLDRKALPVPSKMLAENLARLGVSAYYERHSTRVRACVRGLSHNRQLSPLVALAEGIDIEVDGQPLRLTDRGEPLNLRWLAASDGEFDLYALDDVSAAVLWLGDVPALARYLGADDNNAQMLLNAVVLFDYAGYGVGSYCEWLDELEIEYAQVADDVLGEASKAFEPDMVARRAVYYGLVHASAAATGSGHYLERVTTILGGVNHPDARRLAARVADAEKSLEALRLEMVRVGTAHGRRAGVLPPAPRGKAAKQADGKRRALAAAKGAA